MCPECGRPVFRFTDRAREVIVQANRQALLLYITGDPRQRSPRWWVPQTRDAWEIEPAHILIAVVSGPHGIAYHAIQHAGADMGGLSEAVLRRIPRTALRQLPQGARLPLSQSSRVLVNDAIEEAAALNHNWVGTEHLLLAMCRSRRDKILKRVLADAKVTYVGVRTFVIANIDAANGVGVPANTPRA